MIQSRDQHADDGDPELAATEVEDALRITTVQTAAGSSDMALAFTEVEDALAIAGVAAAETDEHFRTLGETTLFVADSVASGFAIMADAMHPWQSTEWGRNARQGRFEART